MITVMILSSGCQWVVTIVATFYNCSLNGVADNNNSLYEPPHSVPIPSVSSGEIPLHAVKFKWGVYIIHMYSTWGSAGWSGWLWFNQLM